VTASVRTSCSRLPSHLASTWRCDVQSPWHPGLMGCLRVLSYTLRMPPRFDSDYALGSRALSPRTNGRRWYEAARSCPVPDVSRRYRVPEIGEGAQLEGACFSGNVRMKMRRSRIFFCCAGHARAVAIDVVAGDEEWFVNAAKELKSPSLT
jgi:hypothetical protein